MVRLKMQKLLASLLVASILLATFAPLAQAATVSAPVAQQLRDRQVRGTLTGGQFAKIWLGLEPEQSGAQINVVAEWDRADALQNGLGFFILNDEGLRRLASDS